MPSRCAVLHAFDPMAGPLHPPSPGRAAPPWRTQQDAFCILPGMGVLVHSTYRGHPVKNCKTTLGGQAGAKKMKDVHKKRIGI